MSVDLMVQALVTLVTSAIGYGAVRAELVRLRKEVQSHALEQVEVQREIAQLDKRVTQLEHHAA